MSGSGFFKKKYIRWNKTCMAPFPLGNGSQQFFNNNRRYLQWTSRSPLSASETLFLSNGGSEKSCSLKTAAVTSQQADLPYLLRVLKTLSLSGGGSEKDCSPKIAAINSEQVDLVTLLRVIEPGAPKTALRMWTASPLTAFIPV